ncbi:[NiFe]-hydrogenase assembly chaperone HybE [Denitromonas sp.]|uniref:[NiFe]-hydrogenase assembly chaperone HybE n=1 Tax=Denitromonas sp. TaxID=2734609 RepID=UPI002AFEBB98|nr:[NiFe]-hydrogenase assembly chaperone HybE [Denitromonas sp.]
MTQVWLPYDTNPAPVVASVFRRIHTERMAVMPICNRALSVAVPAFERWQGDWVGVLVAPWAINLLILPGGGAFEALSVGMRQRWSFPSGDYDFLGSEEAGLGPYQSCSLFSPVSEFDTQDEAVAVARAALAGLLAVPPQARRTPVNRRAFLRSALGRSARP